MRQISAARRRVVVLAGGLASMSGVGPILLKDHHRAQWVWMALIATLLVKVIVMMARLRRDESCV